MAAVSSPSLLSLSEEALEERVVALGGRPFHARIARREVLDRGVLDYESMSSLPAPLRARLAEELPILSGVELSRSGGRPREFQGFSPHVTWKPERVGITPTAKWISGWW